MRVFSSAFFAALLIALSGCSTVERSGGNGLTINRIQVVNQSATNIDDFRLEVPKTGGVVATNRILRGREFSNGVPPFAYRGNTVTIRWKQDGRPYSAGAIKAAEPVDPGQPVTAVIAIRDRGRFSVYFE